MQLLKEKNGINVKSPDIPDYLDPKFAVNQTKRNSISTNIKEVKNNLGDRRNATKSIWNKAINITNN